MKPRCTSLLARGEVLVRCQRPEDHDDHLRLPVGYHANGVLTWRTEDETGWLETRQTARTA